MAHITISNLKYRYPNTDNLVLDGISCQIKHENLSASSAKMERVRVPCVRRSSVSSRIFTRVPTQARFASTT